MYRIDHSDQARASILRPQVVRRPKFAFLVNGEGQTLESLRQSNLASVRMRVCLAAQAFESLGAEVAFFDGELSDDVSHVVVTKPDFLSDDSRYERWTTALEIAHKKGVQLIVDFSDNHLIKPGPRKDFYEWVLPKTNCVICNSQPNANAVESLTKGRVEVIEDPIECELRPPKKVRTPFPTLLWFGHRSNLPYLIRFLTQDFKPDFPVTVLCLTNECPIPEEVTQVLATHSSPLIDVMFVEWSSEAMEQAAELADVCILPAGVDDPVKVGASSNRLLTALALGLPVAADRLPAYAPFQDYFVDIRGSRFDALYADPSAFHEQVLKAQENLLGLYRSEVISQDWLRLGRNQIKHLDQTDTPIRLNLGCGDKIIPGYLNVDVVDQRAGKKPDVICDIRQLRLFPTDYADEVIAIHVVEHFWRWEVESILREWLRVLKPGGRLVLECPNLRSACEAFLKAESTKDLAGPEGQTNMWVFYGDPKWRDPLMNHRWGYTPESLAHLLEKVGCVEVRQEPAMFKLREPRDMRVVGRKAD